MAETEPQLRLIRFGDFEVDLRSGELRKAGVKQKFGGQPFQVLIILLVHPGEVVTREELQKRLWPDTFVDDSPMVTRDISAQEIYALEMEWP
jgi:DNA-binding winged helix-turn-helix (wHTH) protein